MSHLPAPSISALRLMTLFTEDWYGLWEVLWYLRDRVAWSTEDQIWVAAKTTIDELLSSGCIEIAERIDSVGQVTPLSNEEARSRLALPESWREPRAGEVQVVVGATPEGERAYYRLGLTGLPRRA